MLSKYVDRELPEPPPLPERTAYGEVMMKAMGSLFDVLKLVSTPPGGVKLEWPVPMEHLRQGSGFILYRSQLPASVRPGSRLSVLEVYIGVIEHHNYFFFVLNRVFLDLGVNFKVNVTEENT